MNELITNTLTFNSLTRTYLANCKQVKKHITYSQRVFIRQSGCPHCKNWIVDRSVINLCWILKISSQLTVVLGVWKSQLRNNSGWWLQKLLLNDSEYHFNSFKYFVSANVPLIHNIRFKRPTSRLAQLLPGFLIVCKKSIHPLSPFSKVSELSYKNRCVMLANM